MGPVAPASMGLLERLKDTSCAAALALCLQDSAQVQPVITVRGQHLTILSLCSPGSSSPKKMQRQGKGLTVFRE